MTFYADAKVFAEEQVKTELNGILPVYPNAEEPLLKPSQEGYWSREVKGDRFDFATETIKSDTTLYWVKQW